MLRRFTGIRRVRSRSRRRRSHRMLLLAPLLVMLVFLAAAPSTFPGPGRPTSAPPRLGAGSAAPGGLRPASQPPAIRTPAATRPGAGLSGLAALAGDFARQMRRAGPASSAYVYDITTGRALYVAAGDTPRPPASLEKIYTSVVALQRLGPNARLTTTVLGDGQLGAGGVWRGSLYLRGGGDPTLGTAGFDAAAYGEGATVSELVAQLRARGLRHVTGAVLGDDTYFDSRRGGPATAYRPDLLDLGGELSALAFDHGQVGRGRAGDGPAGYAALSLAGALRAAHVSVRGRSGTAAAPAAARPLAAVSSPPLASLLALMNAPSDNFFAEMLVKQLGARDAGAGTTAAGAGVIAAGLAGFGVHARIADGSGLSSADVTTARELASVLADVEPTPLGAVLRSSLADPGRSGTLAGRMRGTRAAGHCQAKTGTLLGVSNLAGYCLAADGDTMAFALLMGGIDATLAHRLQDKMAITLADFSGAA